MSSKNGNKAHLSDTLNALDNAVDQWNSLTNKDKGEQASDDNKAVEQAKALLQQLREQIEEFDFDDKQTKATEESDEQQPPPTDHQQA